MPIAGPCALGRLRRGALARPVLALVLVLAGCAGSGPTPEDVAAERLVAALCHALRLVYDERVAAELVPAAPAPPTESEHDAAWTRVQAALQELGVHAEGADARTIDAARDVLLAHDVVVLPPGMPHADPGLCLARVTAREAGLEREVIGRTVRYRRVEHEGVLLPDYATYAALRLGRPVRVPLARGVGPTVYVDRAEVARRAGKGGAAHLDAAALAAQVELRQVAALRFAEDLLVADPRARVLHHASVLLACLVEGDEAFFRAELERLATDELAAPEVRLGARAAQEALAAEGGAGREAARRALARLRG